MPYDLDGWYDEDTDDGQGCDCEYCLPDDDDDDYGGLSSYRLLEENPELEFHGAGPLFFGMELEITSGDKGAQIAYDTVRKTGLGWLKSDCSVRGFEMCTHPMDYQAFMSQFPWDLLPELSQAGCRSIAMDNGMHIHVSRAGFAGVAHQYRWMKLWYRNPRKIQDLAGRPDSGWGDFHRETREKQFTHLKIRSKYKRGYYDMPYNLRNQLERQGMFDICSRYDAINTLNRQTLEIRAFASTLDPDIARARLQLAASSVEYTRDMTAKQAFSGGWTWDAYSAWVRDHAGTYPHLAPIVAGAS